MVRKFCTYLNQLIRDEKGSASVEFVLIFPIYLSFILMSIELGFITMRHTLLERGLDVAVREVRLGTGSVPQHDQIKDIVCANAIMILNCDTKLRLEMRPADPFQLSTLDTDPDCTDAAEPAKPVRISREVTGHPVQDHTQVRLMGGVDQIAKLVGRAVADGGGKQTHRLIPPGPVKGMFA